MTKYKSCLTSEDLKLSFSLFCCVYGIGTLGMPANYARAGPYYATIGLICLAFSNVYATIVISKCFLVVPSHVQTLGDLGEHCLSKFGRYLTLFSQMGVCLMLPTTFLVLGSRLLTTLFPNSFGPYGWIIIMSLTILPVAWKQTLKESSGSAIVGCVGTILADFLSLGVIAYYFSGVTLPTIAPNTNFQSVISCFGNLTLAYGAAVVIPSIQREHSDPTRMPRVILFTLSLTSVLFMVIAMSGYFLVGCQIPGNLLYAIADGSLGFTANRSCIIVAYLAMQLHITIAFTVYAHPAFYIGERAFLGLHKMTDNHIIKDEDYRAESPTNITTNPNEQHSAVERHLYETPATLNNFENINERESTTTPYTTATTPPPVISNNLEIKEVLSAADRIKSIVFRTFVIACMTGVACIWKDKFVDLADFVGASAMSLSCIVLPFIFYLKLFWCKIQLYDKVICMFIVFCCTSLAIYLSFTLLKKIIAAQHSPINFPYCPARYQDVVFTNTSYYQAH